jgi:hypothetical protein
MTNREVKFGNLSYLLQIWQQYPCLSDAQWIFRVLNRECEHPVRLASWDRLRHTSFFRNRMNGKEFLFDRRNLFLMEKQPKLDIPQSREPHHIHPRGMTGRLK